MSDRPKIVLGEEDFADGGEDVAPAMAHPATLGARAPAPALSRPPATRWPPAVDGIAVPHVQQVSRGARPAPALHGTGLSNWLTTPGRALFAATCIGVLAAWALTEVAGLAEVLATSKTAADAHVGVWTGVIGIVFGGVLLCFDNALAGVWEAAMRQFATAAIPLFAAAFVAGFAANAVYLQILEHVAEAELRGEGIAGANDVRFYLARALGWALFGIGVGVTFGLLKRSRRQALNGALGGAIGGTAGGIVFQLVSANLQASNSVSRLAGLAAVGGLIAAATRVVETARREAWLQVLAGGMAGKEFIIYHHLTRIGSSPDCEIFLVKDPAVAKVHATIEDREGRRAISAMNGATVLVNDRQVASEALRSGDIVQIGGTVIAYSERSR